MRKSEPGRNGFTLIELLVAMTIIALLLSIVAPRYFNSISKAEEAVLREDLLLLRSALDKYRADVGKYPDALDDLVKGRYVRNIPVDPVTKRADTWLVIPPSNGEPGGVFDIRSGAQGAARDGTLYADW